jgi:BAG domain
VSSSTPSDWSAYAETWYQDLQKHVPALSAFLGLKPSPPPTLLSRLLPAALTTHLAADLRNSPQLLSGLATLFLAVILALMWGSRLGSWGSRLGSPFTRGSGSGDAGESPLSPDPPTVTDSDFSYITAADIAKAKAKESPDALVLKHRRVSYPVHFPGGSIDAGEVTVGQIRDAAAAKLELPKGSTGRVKLFFRGKNLKDDSRTAKEEGMRSGANQTEILMVIGEKLEVPASAEDEEDEEVEEDDEDGHDKAPGAKKKRRNKKKKRGGKASGQNSGTATPATSNTGSNFNPDATFVPTFAPPRPPPPASAPPQMVAQTPLQKLDAIATHFHTKLVPQCVSFISRPPSDAAKKEFEHKKLTETILAQILLKLDAVETEGDQTARQKRKDLVKEVQGMLNQLDAVMNG